MRETPYIGTDGYLIEYDAGMDLSAATNPYFLVKKPSSGTTVTWPAAIVAIDGKTHFMRYVAKAGDLDEPGVYKIHAHYTLGEWSGPVPTYDLNVKALFT
jgi:hypothetical protein